MEKKCPNCGNTLPEEAAFCLECFTEIVPATKVPPPTATPNIPKGSSVFSKAQATKKIICGICIAIAFLLVMSLLITVIKATVSNKKAETLSNETETTIIHETSTVAVTNTSGEAVTDTNGQQVYQVIDVTRVETITTTEPRGFFDKIIDAVTTDKENNDNGTTKTDKQDSTTANSNKQTTKNVTTTKKETFFDKLFNNNDEEETATSTTTEEHGTTENQATTATSSATTEKPSSTTTKPTTTTTKPTTISQVYETENSSYYFEYKAYSSAYPEGNITLTKYVGNASIVTIPSYIDGRKVAGIDTDCFINDAKIKEIHFDDETTSVISFSRHSFNNLSSLTRIVSNNRSTSLSPCFAYKCPITYIGKGGSADNKLIDGAIYSGNSFLWFTAHPSYTVLNLPDWCTSINNGHNLSEVDNLQVINAHKNVKNFPRLALHYGKGLKAINVEEGNPDVFSKNGVLFYVYGADTFYTSFYPYCKTDKSFVMPENSCLSNGQNSSKTVNNHLEELWLPTTSTLKAPDANYFYNTCYPNLKKIYIAPNHPQYDDIKATFQGELIVTEF